MKKHVKIIILSIFVILTLTTISFCAEDVPLKLSEGIYLDDNIDYILVNRGTAILLMIMQFLEIIVPITFFITMILLNKKKNNKKISIKVIGYLIISILIGLGIAIVGECALIFLHEEPLGYPHDTIYYHGKELGVDENRSYDIIYH